MQVIFKGIHKLEERKNTVTVFDTMAINCILKYLNYPRCLDLAWQASCH